MEGGECSRRVEGVVGGRRELEEDGGSWWRMEGLRDKKVKPFASYNILEERGRNMQTLNQEKS